MLIDETEKYVCTLVGPFLVQDDIQMHTSLCVIIPLNHQGGKEKAVIVVNIF